MLTHIKLLITSFHDHISRFMEGAAMGLAAADLALTTKAAADSFPARILSPSSAMIAR